MISYLEGTLIEKSPTRVVLDVNGVGYEVNIPLSTYERLGSPGDRIKILTYFHVRDDAMQLYGFVSPGERSLFVQLLSVSGIGPKVAQSILSGTSVEDFRRWVVTQNIGALTAIPGIGKKTAERLVVELKDKLAGPEAGPVERFLEAEQVEPTVWEEALLALTSLGYQRPEAKKALEKVIREKPGKLSVEELIKRALKTI